MKFDEYWFIDIWNINFNLTKLEERFDRKKRKKRKIIPNF